MGLPKMMREPQVTTSQIKDDYNRIYATSGLRAHSAYYRWLLKLLHPTPNARALDVSCGEGIFLREFAKWVKQARVYGVELSDKALAISRANASSAHLVHADGQYLPFAGEAFDYVSCLGSLEHYLDPEKGMRELCRVGKPGALFCIVLPNSVSIDAFLHVAEHGARLVEDFQIIERTATRTEWEGLLRKNGFDVVRVHGSNLWPELFQEGTCKVKSLAKYGRRLLVKMVCPVNLAREFVFICRKSGAAHTNDE